VIGGQDEALTGTAEGLAPPPLSRGVAVLLLVDIRLMVVCRSSISYAVGWRLAVRVPRERIRNGRRRI
jgi:hypothetical protein